MPKPNWLEELAENWFRMNGYITQLHVRVADFGRRELDLLAFNDEEFVMVDLQTYLGERGSATSEAKELVRRFKIYDKLLRTPPYKDVSRSKRLRRIFISGVGERQLSDFKNLVTEAGIEFMPMEDFIKRVLYEVRKYAKIQRWPFSPNDISRLLYELIRYEFIEEI